MSRQENRVGRPGEFRGDFTRDTFHVEKHYSRVFMQQGRVSIDSDWNEQVSILNHYQRMLASAVIGPHAAPWNCPNDFSLLLTDDGKYHLRQGYYWVNGLMCMNDNKSYTGALADLLECKDQDEDEKEGSYLFYLDVWESHVTAIDDAGIREQALGGADTATRARINWKIRAQKVADYAGVKAFLQFDAAGNATGIDYNGFMSLIQAEIKPGRGFMSARGKPPKKDVDLCSADSSVGYRGKENQLYRVEICRGDDETPSFKWSRDNSAAMFPVRDISNETVTLERPGCSICASLRVNDWVEVVSADAGCQVDKCVLYQVVAIDEERYSVTLDHNVAGDFDEHALAHACLRRWDHAGGDGHGIPLAKAVDDWFELEDGVQIRFDRSLDKLLADKTPEKVALQDAASERETGKESGRENDVKPVEKTSILQYRSGDYWLIPARSASNSIEWPMADGQPKPQLPHGVVHHYAPLRLLIWDAREVNLNLDTRRVISQNWQPVPQVQSVVVLPGRGAAKTDASPQVKNEAVETGKKKVIKKVTKKVSKK